MEPARLDHQRCDIFLHTGKLSLYYSVTGTKNTSIDSCCNISIPTEAILLIITITRIRVGMGYRGSTFYRNNKNTHVYRLQVKA